MTTPSPGEAGNVPAGAHGVDEAAVVTAHPALARPAVVAAVGARELSPAGGALCEHIGRALAACGHLVRTGGAPGADAAYARAAVAAGGEVEIVLPWAGFAAEPPAGARTVVCDLDRHEAWAALADAQEPARHYGGRTPSAARRLAARNAGIVLGGGGLAPRAALCVAVHAGDAPSGGTAHALLCARAAGVPALVLSQPLPPADRGRGEGEMR